MMHKFDSWLQKVGIRVTGLPLKFRIPQLKNIISQVLRITENQIEIETYVLRLLNFANFDFLNSYSKVSNKRTVYAY